MRGSQLNNNNLRKWRSGAVDTGQSLFNRFLPGGEQRAERDELLKRLAMLKTTDMALIVSPSQNEIEQVRAHGLASPAAGASTERRGWPGGDGDEMLEHGVDA